MNYHQKRGSCIIIFLIVFTIDAAIAGPNASSGCAIDLDDSTHDYDVNISSKDIESKGIIGSKDEVTISVVAQNVSDLDTFQVEINYDPDLIQFIRAYENTSQETVFLQQNGGISTGLMVAEKQSGTINIASALIGKDKEEAPDGTGIIAFLDFKILNNTKKIHLSLSNVYYINSDGVKDHITHKQDAFIFASIFIKTSSSKGGKIEPSGIFSVDSGESVNFNIVPDACHRIANVKIDGISQGALTAYSFNNITRNHQIRVRFTPIKEVFRYTPECWKNQFPDIGEDQDDFDKDGYSNLYEYLNDTDPTQADIPGAYMGYQSSLDKNEHLPYHVVFTNPSHPRASQGEAFNIDIMYTSSENDGMDLTNFNLLIHFDSSMLRLSHISNQLTGTTINAINTIESSEHSDNDHFTDKLIDLTFNPGSIQLPAKLCTLTYTIVSEDIDNPRLGDISYIRFCSPDLPVDSEFHGIPAMLEMDGFNLDIDGNGKLDALTDGLFIIRYLFGIIDQNSAEIIAAENAPRKQASKIWQYINNRKVHLDVDGNGYADALTDGLLILRYLFGIDQSPALTQNAIAEDATRQDEADVVEYIKRYVFD